MAQEDELEATGTTQEAGEQGLAAPVAPEEAPAQESSGDAPLFSATYETTPALLEHYVDLLVGPKQKRFALVMAFVDVALALVVAFASPGAWPLALVLVCVGFGMLWYRGNAARLNARKIMARLDPADARRTVNVYPGRVELVRASGETYSYGADELTSVTADASLAVLAFEREGVTVPAQGMTHGDFTELVSWANEYAGGAASAK